MSRKANTPWSWNVGISSGVTALSVTGPNLRSAFAAGRAGYRITGITLSSGRSLERPVVPQPPTWPDAAARPGAGSAHGTGPQPCGGTGGPSAGGPQPSGGRSGGCWDKVPSLSAIWTAQSKGSGLPSGYRPIADRSPGKATLQSNHNDNAVKCTMPEVLPACALLGFRNAVAGLRDIGIGCVAVSPV